MQFSKGGKTPDVRSKEYAEEYERRYGEKYIDDVKNAPFRVVGRAIKKATDKVKKGAKKLYKKVTGKKGGGIVKYSGGGRVRIDGCATRGKTKGRMV